MPNAYGDATTIRRRCGLTYEDLGLADDSTLTALIVSLNERASAAVEHECRRDFIQHANVTEKYDGTNRDTMRLRGWPVISITSVTVNGVLQAADTYRVLPSDGGMPNAGILQRKNHVWPKSWEGTSIVYSWGFADPPLGVRQVVEDIVIRALQNAAAAFKGKAASSVSLDGFSVTFTRDPVTLTEQDKAALAPYRSVIIA